MKEFKFQPGMDVRVKQASGGLADTVYTLVTVDGFRVTMREKVKGRRKMAEQEFDTSLIAPTVPTKARVRGSEVFAKGGKRVPALDREVMKLIKENGTTPGAANEVLTSWLAGWDYANIYTDNPRG